MRLRNLVSIPFIAGQWSLLQKVQGDAEALVKFQSPSLRGSGRFGGSGLARRQAGPGFQSPSLRGSGRFTAGGRLEQRRSTFQSPSLRGSGRFMDDNKRSTDLPGFNPLHCGAVVASRPPRLHAGGRRPGVSIPFIAGQWSLHVRRRPPPRGGAMFQSPSLRGSGRFAGLRTGGGRRVFVFQSPSLRGSGRFDRRSHGRRMAGLVSIPFIAGQWSLQFDAPAPPQLHELVSIPFIAGQWSLLPGAAPGAGASGDVSIPFIAGQWSLRIRASAENLMSTRFNPLHCGAVVASRAVIWVQGCTLRCFNPLHCGAVVASPRSCAGGWKQPLMFQSPSLRGSGRFQGGEGPPGSPPATFQSPSLRGSGRFGGGTESNSPSSSAFQSPSLRGSGRFPSAALRSSAPRSCFNPLHCGAVVASRSGAAPKATRS